jgi:hypothetical protein
MPGAARLRPFIIFSTIYAELPCDAPEAMARVDPQRTAARYQALG